MPTLNQMTKDAKPVGHDIQDPQKLVQNLVDKKIRNLEKRKTRLEELRELSTKGKELEAEQQQAVKKLDQVVEMIDLMKDLNKSISEVLAENTKQQKRLAKKELLDRQQERQQQELTRLKTVLQYQDILGRFETSVRTDFSKGTNGAIKLTEDQISQLDKLYALTSDVTDSSIETTAEKLIALADGKTREAWTGVTYQQLKELMNTIVETKYFSHETAITTTTTTSAKPKTHNSNDVSKSTKVTEESIKSFANETELTTNATKTTSSNQFHSLPPNPDFSATASLNQLQSQFVGSGISFMNNPLEKDPAVVAVASAPNSFSYPPSYGLTSDSLINTSIPDSNNSSLNAPKSSNYDNTSSMSTIPTQTFTNQQFAGLIPGANAVYSAVPVTLATVPMAGLVAQDLSGQDLMTAHTYPNQQNFINSSATDKLPNLNPSHEQRGTHFNSDDNSRNNRFRGNRPENQKKNLNGTGNRGPRNPNKGPGYQNQTSSFGNQFNPKYENQLNGSSNFGNNSYGDKYPNNSNNFSGSRGRPQPNRSNRGDNRTRPPPMNSNGAYNTNFGTTAAK